MADEVKSLIEGMNKGFEAFKAKQDAMDAEVKKLGSADYVSRDELSKIETALQSLEAKNDQLILAAKRAQRFGGADAGEDMDAKAAKFGSLEAKSFGASGAVMTADTLAEYKAATERYLRKGDRALTEAEFKALSVGGDADGGFVVHPDMSGRTVAKVYETSIMRAYASVQSISSDALEGLYDNDEAAYGWVGETGSRAETDTPQLGRWSIPVHEVYANPAATQRILDDAEINLETWLSAKVADKFARAENAAFVSGDGVAAPRGFLTYSNGTDLTNSIEQVVSGASGAFAAAPNGGDVLITALMSLKAPYMANANWFMNRSTLAAVRKLKDSNGAYIWSPSIAAGQPSTLLGYGVAPAFEDMPAIAANSLSIAVGDMRSAYQIVDRIGIRVLRDPYTNKPFVHFYATKRVGGAVINGEAIKLIKFSA